MEGSAGRGSMSKDRPSQRERGSSPWGCLASRRAPALTAACSSVQQQTSRSTVGTNHTFNPEMNFLNLCCSHV